MHILLLHQESYTITGHLAAGGGDVAKVRVLAPHCCGPSLISGPGVESGLSKLVLVLTLRVFLQH